MNYILDELTISIHISLPISLYVYKRGKVMKTGALVASLSSADLPIENERNHWLSKVGLTAGDFAEVKAWDTLGDLTRQNAPFMDDFRYKPPYSGSPSMKSWDNKSARTEGAGAWSSGWHS